MRPQENDPQVEAKENQPQAIVHLVSAEQFDGPIPHPTILKEYNEAVPDAAERILAMAERDQAHAHEVDNRFNRHEIRKETLGMSMGFFLAILAIAAGTWLIAHDKSLEGFGIFLAAAGVMIGSAIYKHRQHKNSSD